MIAACRQCLHQIAIAPGERAPNACPECGLDWIVRIPVSEVARTSAPHDFEFGPLARYLDAHPGRHAALMRHDGKWVIRVGSVIGYGATVGEASASVCNALFVNEGERSARAELPTIPEKP